MAATSPHWSAGLPGVQNAGGTAPDPIVPPLRLYRVFAVMPALVSGIDVFRSRFHARPSYDCIDTGTIACDCSSIPGGSGCALGEARAICGQMRQVLELPFSQGLAVKLEFEIDGTTIEFARNPFTGQCTLNTDAGEKVLASSLNPFTHFSAKLTRQWQCSINGHQVIVEKERPLLFAGFRPQTYRIFVDGKLVQESTGY